MYLGSVPYNEQVLLAVCAPSGLLVRLVLLEAVVPVLFLSCVSCLEAGLWLWCGLSRLCIDIVLLGTTALLSSDTSEVSEALRRSFML